MNITSARMIRLLIDGPRESMELVKMLGIGQRQFAYLIKDLSEQDYLEKNDTIIKLKDNLKTTLLRDASKITDIEKLLYESNQAVISSATEPVSINDIIRRTGLSQVTVYKSISELRSIGAITQEGGKVKIDDSKQPLVLFANMLKVQREKRYESEGAEVIYRDDSKVIRRISAGRAARGVTTGFSLFSEFGVDYNTAHNYFSEHDYEMDIQDVLIDAVYAANYSKDKLGLLVCMVFYAKHKDKMDIFQLRRKAAGMGISEIWIDVEAYMRRRKLKNPELFLPWDEFLTKARLYDVPAEKYTLPEPSMIFEEINKKLKDPMTIYLFGGENMRIKGLKDSTKDCDIVVGDKKVFDRLAEILTGELGYRTVIETQYSDEDMRIYPDNIFVHEQSSRIDMFTSTIMRDMSLSSSMKEMSDMRDYGRLKVGLLRNEHVFLLKAVASREGDIQDMAALVRGGPGGSKELLHGPFDWDLVWREIQNQEQLKPTKDFARMIFEQISYLAEQTEIVAPFLDKLRRHTVDGLIKMMLRGGVLSVRDIIDLLIGRDITEGMVRNRIESLAYAKVIEKHNVLPVFVTLLKGNTYPEPRWRVTPQHLENYLAWRFYLRPGPSPSTLEGMAAELNDMEFKTMGKIDEAVRDSVDVMIRYEHRHLSGHRLDSAAAMRFCIGMHHPELGGNPDSNFHVRDLRECRAMQNLDKIDLLLRW